MDIKRNEGKYLDYGHCPNCDAACQPEFGDDDEHEYVTCCDCKIVWDLQHIKKMGLNNNIEAKVRYRVSNIQTFDEFGIEPYECR